MTTHPETTSIADRALIALDAVNREAVDEPPESHLPGPGGFFAAALGLRAAYSDLTFEVHGIVAQSDLVAVANAFAPTGKPVAVAHTDHDGHARRLTWVRYGDQVEMTR